MKLKLCLIFFLNVFVAQAQQVNIKGKVVNSKNNQPVAFATISFLSKNMVYPADDNGKFDVASDVTADDSITFSSVGFESQTIKINPNKADSLIVKLVPVINILSEVVVNKRPFVKVGSIEKSSKVAIWQHTGEDKAEFMEGSEGVKGVIQTVGFYLSNGTKATSGGDVTAPFRIRLFAVGTGGVPGVEITKDIIIVAANNNKAWFDVDISSYNIQSPDSGFYVSFSLLNLKYYKLKKGAITRDKFGGENETIDSSNVHHKLGAINTADNITPRLGYDYKIKQHRSYFSATTLQNMSWHWEKEYFDYSYLIRATIAPD